MRPKNEKLCDQNLIHAYVDGELEAVAQLLFEKHLDSCANCRSNLRDQQKFICELDAVFAGEVEVSIPQNFSRTVAARAVSDMSGVRSPAENKKALAFSLMLGIAGFVLLGPTARQMIVVLVRQVIGKITGLIELGWNTLSDSIASLAVISRVLGRKFIVETGNATLLLVLLTVGVLLLSRLISNYHRTGAID